MATLVLQTKHAVTVRNDMTTGQLEQYLADYDGKAVSLRVQQRVTRPALQ